MNLDEYQQEAYRTAPNTVEAYPPIIRAAFHAFAQGQQWKQHNDIRELFDVLIWGQGLAGEAGEVCDLLKKFYGHGKPFDQDALKKELGDVLWYVANLATAHGLTLGDVAQANVDKLRERYPNGFSVVDANRGKP